MNDYKAEKKHGLNVVLHHDSKLNGVKNHFQRCTFLQYGTVFIPTFFTFLNCFHLQNGVWSRQPVNNVNKVVLFNEMFQAIFAGKDC